jgi:fatty-acyl-CoA synthase
MRNAGLGSWIARRARRDPERTALVFEDRRWTYAELAADVEVTARSLAGRGLGRGDRVCYTGPNHPAALRVAFAAGLLGAVFVPVSHRLAAPELAHIVADADCRLLVHGPGGDASALADELPSLQTIGTAGLLSAEAARKPPDVPVSLDDLCFLIYTSGTTGRPKGVMLTHGNVTWNVVNFLSIADFRMDDVTLAIAPLHRAGGWGVTLLPTLYKGGAVLLMASFEPNAALALIERHRVTTLFGGPELLGALVTADGWASTDVSSLRWVVSGGDIVHEGLIRAYHERGVTLLQGYGLTEAGPMVLMLDEADALRRIGAAGKPPLHCDVRIVRTDMSDAAAGERGEILVKGPNVTPGYWRRPADTEAAFVDDWLRTGDVGRFDDEGYVYVVDRLKDMFVSDGENVFPAEIERVLAEHPAVAEAAVVAAPDARLGHAAVAFVVLRDGVSAGEHELMDFCRRRLAAFKVPVAVRFRDALPRNAAGKLLKGQLRELGPLPTAYGSVWVNT